MASTYNAGDGAAYELLMGRWSRLLAATFLDFVALPEGTGRVLDVGSGTGSLARAVSTRTGADVLGVDVAAPYIDHARAITTNQRVSFEVQDASALPFEAGSFDAAVSLLALNFVPEFRAAAQEMIRVTRPGGCVAAACWSVDGGFPTIRMFWDTAAALDPGASAARGRYLSAPLTHRGEMAFLFRSLGLADIVEADLTIWMRFENFADYWTPFELGEGSLGAYLARLESPAQTRLREAMYAAYTAGRPDGPREFPAIAHAAKACIRSA